MTDENARAERIRANLQAGIDTARRIMEDGIPRRSAIRASTDELLNMAGALVALDVAAATAAELLGAIDRIELTDRAGLARAALIGLLEQAGYVTLIDEAPNGEG